MAGIVSANHTLVEVNYACDNIYSNQPKHIYISSGLLGYLWSLRLISDKPDGTLLTKCPGFSTDNMVGLYLIRDLANNAIYVLSHIKFIFQKYFPAL